MYHCPRCNDFLDGHKCNTCNQYFRCLNPDCSFCSQFPGWDLAFGSDFTARHGYTDDTRGHMAKYKRKYAVNYETQSTLYHRTNCRKYIPVMFMMTLENEKKIVGKNDILQD